MSATASMTDRSPVHASDGVQAAPEDPTSPSNPNVTTAWGNGSSPVPPPPLTRREKFIQSVNRTGDRAGLPFVKRIRWAYRPYLAEFLGTLVFTALTAGLVSNYQLQIAKGHMTYFGETFYSGIALMYAIYVAGGVSGGHINPAITLLFAVWRGFPWRKVPGYWFAQFFGAFCGAGIVYLMYLPHYELANMGERNIIGPYETGSIFATVPSQVRGNYSCFFGEIVGSAILGAAIFAFIDRYNIPPTYLAPIAIGLAQGVIYAGISSPGRLFLNPARDFGSRVLLAAAGYGGEVFSAYDGYMWIPIVGPMIGTVTGGALYDFFIVTGPTPEQIEAKEMEEIERGE